MKSRLPHRFFPIFFILYEFACNLSNDLYLPAMPEIAATFSTEVSAIGLTIAAWLAGNASFQWLLGPLSDRFGRRTVLFSGGILFLMATFFCAIASNLGFMLIARFAQGIGVCSMMIAGYASIHESYSDRDAVKILAWITSISIIAPMVGPLLGGLLLQWTNWRWLFGTLLLVAIIALAGLWVVMPFSQHDAAALNPKRMFHDYRQLLQNKLFLLRCGTLGLIYTSLIIWITASPEILIEQYHLSTVQFGLSQCPVFGCYIIGAQLGQKLIDRYDGQILIRRGIQISILGAFGLLVTVIGFSSLVWGIIGAMSILVLGAGLTCAPLNRACFQSSTLNKGITSAMFYTILMVTGTMGSLLVSLSFMANTLNLMSLLVSFAIGIAWFFFRKSNA
ncbi:MFS transporter [Candidatus Berkiella aquae]|uniref:MFS transporter n=1 Tax=Candidatus Berkiella aquae TaxID=295108 RepID=A0A0Q9YXN3_9GAMM|nr:MFS transporter [Candidatus Berkiella aquae]MCS5711381.1 MFS transporter [Candidatus Berkiella aquae]